MALRRLAIGPTGPARYDVGDRRRADNPSTKGEGGLMASGKRLTVLEMPEDDDDIAAETAVSTTPGASSRGGQETRRADAPLIHPSSADTGSPAPRNHGPAIHQGTACPCRAPRIADKGHWRTETSRSGRSARGLPAGSWLLTAPHQYRSLESTHHGRGICLQFNQFASQAHVITHTTGVESRDRRPVTAYPTPRTAPGFEPCCSAAARPRVAVESSD